jgi:alkylation response protein AidB-like acyl-CoA dehydrogenase
VAAVLFAHAAALEIMSLGAEADKQNGRAIYQLLAEPDGIPLAIQSYHSTDEIDLPAVNGEGRHLLSGKLSFLVLGGLARYAVVPGTRQPGRGSSYYLVDLFADGVVKSAPILTLGLQAAQAVDVTFDQVQARLIGAENQGELYFRKMRSRMSRPAAAISVGIMSGSLQAAIDYARQRYQGGRNIVDWSGVRIKLADMAIQLEAGRCCLSAPVEPESAFAAAIHIGGLACAATVEGVQLLGGNGYMKEYGQEKRMRDARQARSLLGMSGLKKMSYIQNILGETKP